MNKELANRICERLLYEKPNPIIVQPIINNPFLQGKISFQPSYVVDELISSRGLLNADDEQRAVNAIKLIKTKSNFEAVQKELMKKTGGKGIGQFVSEFIRDNSKQPYVTLRQVNAIIKHLKKIGANPKSIAYFIPLQQELTSQNIAATKFDKTIGGPELRKFWEDYHHEILQVAAIGALFIPIPGVNTGLYIALQALDAATYVQEGDRYGALLTAGFALLPGAGKLGKAAVIKMLGPTGMAKLGAKVAAMRTSIAAVKQTILTKIEQAVLKILSANQKEVAKLIALRARQIAASKAGTAINWAANTAGRTVKGAANFIAKGALGYGAVTTAIDPIYKGMGWEEADIDDQIGADEILSGLK